MPELPEVETVCRGLAKMMAGRDIAQVRKNRGDLRAPFPAGLEKLKGHIASITRRAKYILVNLADGRTLVIHLGMSGRITLHARDEAYKPGTHDHMIITLDNGLRAVLNDPRRFGIVALAKAGELEKHKLFSHLGPEPLGKQFTADYLAEKFKGRKTAVKVALMDQELVVGVGNIYAAEALFLAHIDPRTAAGSLKKPALTKLVTAIKKTLEKAIAAGGSSLRDYVQTDGTLGLFQHHFAVYGRAGEKCKGCTCDIKKTGGVQRLTQGGRSTFYCPIRQE